MSSKKQLEVQGPYKKVNLFLSFYFLQHMQF